MFRRTYYVQRAERRADGEQVMRDTSFSSFMCILFIFLLFACLIVIATNWRNLFLIEDEIEYFEHNNNNNKFENIIMQYPDGENNQHKIPKSFKELFDEISTTLDMNSSTELSTTLTTGRASTVDETSEKSDEFKTSDVATNTFESQPTSSETTETKTSEITETTETTRSDFKAITQYQVSDGTTVKIDTSDTSDITSISDNSDSSDSSSTSDSETSQTMSIEDNTKTTDFKRDITVSNSDLIDLDTAETSNGDNIYTTLVQGHPRRSWNTIWEETTETEKATTDVELTTQTTVIQTQTQSETTDDDLSTHTIVIQTQTPTETTEDDLTTQTTDLMQTIQTNSTVRPDILEQYYNERNKVKTNKFKTYKHKKEPINQDEETSTFISTQTTDFIATTNTLNGMQPELLRLPLDFNINDNDNDYSSLLPSA